MTDEQWVQETIAKGKEIAHVAIMWVQEHGFGIMAKFDSSLKAFKGDFAGYSFFLENCVCGQATEHAEKEAFQARFKKLLKIAGDNHELKRAVARIGKAHGAITIFDKDNMWAHRYVADVSMLLERLDTANNKSVDTLRDRMIALSKSEDEQEAWLRDRLTALRFPVVKDVYVSTEYSFYVSFERLLTGNEIMLAGSVSLRIELTYPLPNRYRVVFEAPDVEED